jgi:hypothetical protein
MSIFNILYDAYKHTENMYTSFVGDKYTYENECSELNKNHWSIKETLYLLKSIFLPRLPFKAPLWMPKILRIILFGGDCKYIKDTPEYEDGTCVIFINGIMANEKVVLINKQELKKLINKPINIIHNETDSLIIDLFECLIDKETKDLSEAATFTLYEISKKLTNPKINKVILICHSQGTIITSKMLKGLSLIGLDQEMYVKKLEIYAFSNCSSKMRYIVNTKYPYMEHFANTNDFVARLGCNASDKLKETGVITIDGPVYKVKKSGHLLNSHYINNFKNDFPKSKLNRL